MKKIIIALFMGLVLNLGNPAYGQGVTAIEAQRSARQSARARRGVSVSTQAGRTPPSASSSSAPAATSSSSAAPSRAPATSSTSTSGATDTRSSVEAQRDARQILRDRSSAERAAANPSSPTTTSGDVSSSAPLRSSSPATPEARQRIDDQRAAEINRQAAEQGNIPTTPPTPTDGNVATTTPQDMELTDEEIYDAQNLTEEELAEDRRLTEEAEAEEAEEAEAEEEEEAAAEEGCAPGAFGMCVSTHNDLELIPAIQNREKSWSDAFSRFIDTQSQFLETMGAVDDVKAKQEKMTKEVTVENPPDLDGALARKASEASQWKKANVQQEGVSSLLDEATTNNMVDDTNPLSSADGFLARTFDRMFPSEPEADSETEAKGKEEIKDPLINPATLYYPKTYRQSEQKAGEEAELEGEFLNAVDYVQFVINPVNDGYVDEARILTDPLGGVDKAGNISSLARKSLAFNAFNTNVAMRTNVKGGGMGAFIKKYLKDLEGKTSGGGASGAPSLSAVLTDDLEDDISKYEFMDLLFSKVFMNPAWYVSLDEATPKSLKIQKTEMLAFINMLNWEVSKMIEKVALLSAAELGSKTD